MDDAMEHIPIVEFGEAHEVAVREAIEAMKVIADQYAQAMKPPALPRVGEGAP